MQLNSMRMNTEIEPNMLLIWRTKKERECSSVENWLKSNYIVFFGYFFIYVFRMWITDIYIYIYVYYKVKNSEELNLVIGFIGRHRHGIQFQWSSSRLNEVNQVRFFSSINWLTYYNACNYPKMECLNHL